ncbi:MAG: acetyl/propionyl/methylcrotonyl-CoA carboxylase subunit alpha [Hyphomonadaceae bacterium]|nr:acetyl/propionyl/methylcrotonyl-CoA carboxylase subunit alpha [Hyphomonadaceae bacterium]
MFKSVLVANRAEIACRIFRTARAMGMRCIAVHTEADAKAKHVREADESVLIGPAPAAESYLRGDRIIEAAKASGAEAVHPGYGFLSENPDFAEEVIAAGLIWIGPTPAAIRAMGLKDEAKRIAEEAGVPVVPGYRGEAQDAKTLSKEAKAIGFPVLIKAVAGGGGRGIREVKNAAEFADALASAQREAKAAFGDDRVLVEKLIGRPRHIEVQVFGDKHGNVVHLFERDCSLQRRRQKVIEEAPAPGMTADIRAAMTDAALKAARAVAYENAGTVEFIVDGSGPLRADGFWFLEMNTRLQVEHPVTEMITGLDLVEWQFRVAAGETLPLTQDEIRLDGHAIEARVVAEDPADNFRPSVGRLHLCRWPHRQRVDAGFAEGDAIPSAYDSLLAKIIVHREDRAEAIESAKRALSAAHVFGVATNIGFLRRCLGDKSFAAGDVHVGLIAERLETLSDRSEARRAAAARLAFADAMNDIGADDPWARNDGFRMNAPSRLVWRYEVADQPLLVELDRDGDVVAAARVDGAPAPLDPDLHPDFAKLGAGTIVFAEGEAFAFEPAGASREHADAAAGDEVKAPLPGKVVAVLAKAGQAVKKGDPLVTLEAMKMEHALKAPRDGAIAEIAVAAGAQVKEGALLVRLAAAT